MRVRSLGQEDPLEEEMATHCSILAWRIPWTEEPGGLQSMGLHRIGQVWVCMLIFYHIYSSFFVLHLNTTSQEDKKWPLFTAVHWLSSVYNSRAETFASIVSQRRSIFSFIPGVCRLSQPSALGNGKEDCFSMSNFSCFILSPSVLVAKRDAPSGLWHHVLIAVACGCQLCVSLSSSVLRDWNLLLEIGHSGSICTTHTDKHCTSQISLPAVAYQHAVGCNQLLL